MKIQLLSDLHLETHPQFMPQAAHADVLVLAGDIGSYQVGSQLTDGDFGLARFSPRTGWPTPVVFVPGNHEYDGMDFDATHARLRATCERLGIRWPTFPKTFPRHSPKAENLSPNQKNSSLKLSRDPLA